jgi:hypothetical protein
MTERVSDLVVSTHVLPLPKLTASLSTQLSINRVNFFFFFFAKNKSSQLLKCMTVYLILCQINRIGVYNQIKLYVQMWLNFLSNKFEFVYELLS